MNPCEFFPMQAESPGHQGVLEGLWYTGGAGTLGCLRGLLNERVSCPEREDPGLFWGLRGAWEWILQASHLGKDTGSGRSNQPRTDLHVP